MKDIKAIYYDRHVSEKGAVCHSIYIVGQRYPFFDTVVELQSIDRVMDAFILKFEEGWEFEVPFTEDMSIVYKTEEKEEEQ